MKRRAVITLLRHGRGRVLLLTVLTLLMSLLQVCMALLSRSVIDTVLTAQSQLGTWIFFYVAAVLALVGVYALAAWLSGSTMDILSARLRQELLGTAVYSRDLRLQQFHSGQLLSRGMEDVQTVCDGLVHALPSLVGNLAKLGAAFAGMILIAPKLAPWLALIAGAVVLGTACVRPMLKKQHRKVRQSDEAVMSAMQEDLQQLELIQSLQMQKKLLHRFAVRVKENLSLRTYRRVLTVSSNSMLSGISLLGSGAMLIWGAVQVAEGRFSFGMLTAMLQLLGMLSGPILGLSGTWTRLTAVEVAAGRLCELLDAPAGEQKDTHVFKVRAVVFADVTFTYPGDETPVLEHFSARIPLDRWACLTGISGIGKTTLFKLILGLYAPQSGRVYLQTDAGEVPCSEQTRHLFAYVPQDYALVSGTVQENLQLVTDRDPSCWNKALELAQADFLADLQTPVRENNTGLSKGQLQRLAIARAILMDRPILLLDECTSALDAQTERTVLESLHGLGTQAVLVTHRPQSLESFDQITFVDI